MRRRMNKIKEEAATGIMPEMYYKKSISMKCATVCGVHNDAFMVQSDEGKAF